MTPDPITRLNAALEGRYHVERELGEGGMATVYLAEDLRHERKVALKVLKPELAAVVGAERFLAEIKTTANLQHPHILALYDSGEAGGFLYFVTSFVEGESLRDRVDREKQLSVDEAVTIATKVAGALQYAHEHRVIHRDIKPGNILLQGGEPVVADFGISLAVGAAGGNRLTETGLSLGTPNYMSPEQATGEQNVGPKSDIYALGCVLYEMLVGEPPYTGGTAQAILGKIITRPPDPVTEQRGSVPPNVDAAIRCSLEKVPADRFASAQELARALSDPGFRYGERTEVGAGGARPLWNPLSMGLSAVAVISISALTLVLFAGGSTPPPPVTRSTVDLSEETRLSSGDNNSPSLAISPDGQDLVYVASLDGLDQLYHRPFDRAEPFLLPGTEGASGPFFSPDGQWVGFFSAGVLRKMLLVGGVPEIVLRDPAPPHGATWGPDGFIYYGLHDRSIWRVAADGGTPEAVTDLDRTTGVADHHEPEVLPGASAVLFTLWRNGDDASHVAVKRLDSGEERELVTGTNPRYSPTGHLLFARGPTLWAVRFDLDRLETIGEPAAMVEDLLRAPTIGGSGAQFALARNGTLVYASQSGEAGSRLVRVSRAGVATEMLPEPENYWYPRVSPDGTRLAVGIGPDIWAIDLDRLTRINLTFGRAQPNGPFTWTADSRHVTFSPPIQDSTNALYNVAWDGTEEPEFLFAGEEAQWATSWSSGNESLAFYVTHPESARDLWTASSRPNDFDSTPFLITPFEERAPRFSPDGSWLAYVSNESGRDEVYLLPAPGNPGGKLAISTDGGIEPVWSPDGEELFYRSGSAVMAVEIVTDPSLTIGTPELLFTNDEYQVQTGTGAGNALYDVLPDGQGFVMLQTGGDPTEINVVQNFFEELRRALPD